MKHPKITPRTRCAKMKIRISAKALKALRKFARQDKTSPSEIAVRFVRQLTVLPYKTEKKVWQSDVFDRDKKTEVIYPRLWSDDLAVIQKLTEKTGLNASTIARRAIMWVIEVH